MESDIEEKVKKFLSLAKGDSYHSNYSWDHCYLFFRDFKKLESTEQKKRMDLACLNLGFYLASWGMYRGSTFVSWKNYKIYTGVIGILIKSEFNDLWESSYYDDLLESKIEISKDHEKIKNLFRLKIATKKTLEPYTKITKLTGHKTLNVTDTLITKILLGTMGCVPAYDDNFKKGLKAREISPRSSFSKGSFAAVLNFCRNNLNELRKIKKCVPNSEYHYPLMKVLDLYFWITGAESNKKM